MRPDKRIKYTIDPKVIDLITASGIRNVKGFPLSTLYKYVNGSMKYIMISNANRLAKALGATPKFDHKHRVFSLVFITNKIQDLLSAPNYCFNCGNKLDKNVPLNEDKV